MARKTRWPHPLYSSIVYEAGQMGSLSFPSCHRQSIRLLLRRTRNRCAVQRRSNIWMCTIGGGRSALGHDDADSGLLDHEAVTAFVRKMLGNRTVKEIALFCEMLIRTRVPGKPACLHSCSMVMRSSQETLQGIIRIVMGGAIRRYRIRVRTYIRRTLQAQANRRQAISVCRAFRASNPTTSWKQWISR
jgi:hypothetical protein